MIHLRLSVSAFDHDMRQAVTSSESFFELYLSLFFVTVLPNHSFSVVELIA